MNKQHMQARRPLAAVLLAAALLLCLAAAGCAKAPAGEEVLPIGDSIPKGYSFAGSWYDSGQMVTMTIEESSRRYKANLSRSETGSGDLSAWSMTLSWDSALCVLRYADASRIDVLIETGEDGAVSFTRETAYEKGTGYFYLKNSMLYWVDEKEEYGDGMAFDRLQTE